MRRNRAGRILKFAPFVIIGAVVFGFVVMSLWNWLMPAIFGLHVITYWQGLGLLLLSRIFFGGFRGGRGGPWRGRMMERWEQMSPEEREKFREGMKARCGPGQATT